MVLTKVLSFADDEASLETMEVVEEAYKSDNRAIIFIFVSLIERV